jgi:hypothetical protein
VWVVAVLAAIGMGAFAIVVDNIPAATGLLVIASTGLSWGGVAAVMGAWSPRPGSAAVSGLLVLLGAVATYYTGIALLNTRGAEVGPLWTAGYMWGVIAVVAGPVIGLLGWFARHGTAGQRSLAWGGAGGLLTSQGIYIGARIVRDGLWSEPGPANLLATALVVLPAALVVVGARRASLRLALATMVLVGVVGAVVWSLIVLVI